MPIFKEFAENGELLQEKNEVLNESNLERYINENSVEKVHGYLDALNDVNEQFKDFLEIHSPKSWRYSTNQKIGTQTIRMYEKQQVLIDFLKDQLKKMSP